MKRILLSMKEIAQALGVSSQSIRRAYWRGEITAYRITKILRFDLTRVPRIFLAKGSSTIVRPRATTDSPRSVNTGALPTGIITGGLRIP